MSSEALVIALHHSRAKGAVKLVLLGIANHLGEGGSWPSVAKLMTYANADRRTVQRAIDKLEELGEVGRVIQRGGTPSTHESSDWHRPNLYRFNLECPEDCDRSWNHKTRRQYAPENAPLGTERAKTPPGLDAKTPPGGERAKTPPGGVQKRRPNLNNNHLPLVNETTYVPERAHARPEIEAQSATSAAVAAAVAAAPGVASGHENDAVGGSLLDASASERYSTAVAGHQIAGTSTAVAEFDLKASLRHATAPVVDESDWPTPCPNQKYMPCMPSPSTGICPSCGSNPTTGEVL